jgi:hypothetical protein
MLVLAASFPFIYGEDDWDRYFPAICEYWAIDPKKYSKYVLAICQRRGGTPPLPGSCTRVRNTRGLNEGC